MIYYPKRVIEEENQNFNNRDITWNNKSIFKTFVKFIFKLVIKLSISESLEILKWIKNPLEAMSLWSGYFGSYWYKEWNCY